jgi:aromatic-L-amino-acid/L-tryptophan decarboxylase
MRLGAARSDVLHEATQMVERAWASFDAARLVEPDLPPKLAAVLEADAPASPGDPSLALADAGLVLDHSIAQSRPRYLAYVGSSGLEIGAVADLLAHSYDVNLAVDARAASSLERQTSRWLAEFLGFPAVAGWFTSGGTVSNLSALAAARERALPGSRHDGVQAGSAAVYCSAEVHYSVRRGAELLGFGGRAVRDIAINPATRGLRPEALAAAIDADLAAGVTPIAVVATAGTTLTGAVDPLDAIADVCAARGVWMHVDGAYGVPAAATSVAPAFAGLARADSVTVDAHKWLFVPKACSALLVKDPGAFTAVFGHDEAYIPHDDELPNSVDMTLEYSRPLRALKLWLAFRVHGTDQVREAIEANLAQARYLYERAQASATLEVLPHAPTLSITPIRQVLGRCPDVERHNAQLAEAVQRDGRSYVSPAVIDGRAWLRPCFTNIRTTLADVDEFVGHVDEVGARLCEAGCRVG